MQRRDFTAHEDVEGVFIGQLHRLVAAGQPVMIRDRHGVEVRPVAHVVEHLSHGGRAIVERGVHVKVGFAHEILLNRPQRLAPAVTGW